MNRFYSLVLFATIVSTSAMAQDEGGGFLSGGSGSSNQTTGLGLYLGYSFAKEMDVEFEDSDSTYNTTGAAFLGARYAYLFTERIGALAAMNYTLPREIDSIDFDNGSSSDVGGSFSILDFEFNAYFHAYQGFFIYGGFNYSIPFDDLDANDSEMKGGMGMQLGAGYVILPFLSADLGYKTQNFTVTADDEESSTGRLWGMLLRFTFQLDM
ncbi:MAG: hypothetical protein KDD25_07705 [Bdellovibrionales bacterium]|nr:hypothetical protein [Bdellovibrionales bacterium]